MASDNPTSPLKMQQHNKSPYHSNMNGRIIVISLLVLFVVVLLILALHIYARWFWRRPSRRLMFSRRREGLEFDSQEPVSVGLDKAFVDSLPTVTYKVALPLKDVQECAVCLCEFQENDECRILPKCNHSFHTACIDTWFLSHSTCPLCRTSAEPPNSLSAVERQEASEESISVFLFPQSEGEGLDELDGNELSSLSERSEGEGNPTEQPSRGGNGCPPRIDQPLPSPGWSWRRSTSDRFPQSQGVQFPTNVLFWGNHSHVSSRVSSPRLERGQRGGRSLSHIAIEIPQWQQNLHSSGSSADQSSSSPSGQQLTKSPGTRLNAFKRLLSRERKVFPTEQGGATVSGS